MTIKWKDGGDFPAHAFDVPLAIPEPRSIIVRLPDEAHGRLVNHCRSREVSPEAFVTEAILEKLGAAA